MLKNFRTFLFVFVIFSSLHANHPAIIEEEFLFQNPPFAFCHAATIAQTKSGSLLCAWYAGSFEGANDTAIWQSTRNQTQWSALRKVAEASDTACWNPVLFVLPSDEVLLFYKTGENPRQWSGILRRSYNEGLSWSAEEDLPAGVIGPSKNKPLLLTDGTLLCGSSIESWKRWGCWIDITHDFGYTWFKSTPINVHSLLFGIIQPSLFRANDGNIKLLARSRQIGHICIAESSDNGNTWGSARPLPLPNPNSAIDAVKLNDGRVLLVYNQSQTERFPLNIALSDDDGETWKMSIVLEINPGKYSYPSVIQTDDGNVHIVYTWNNQLIKHVVLDPNQL
jgi:predicted neuraminidase